MTFDFKNYTLLFLLFFLSTLQTNAQWMRAEVNQDVYLRDYADKDSRIIMSMEKGRGLLALPISKDDVYIRIWDYQTGKRGYAYNKYITLIDTLVKGDLTNLEVKGSLKRGGTTLHIENTEKQDVHVEIDQVPYALMPYQEITLRLKSGDHGIWISKDGAFPFWGNLGLADSAEYVLKIANEEDVLISELKPIYSMQDTVRMEFHHVDTVNITPKVKIDTARIVTNKHPQDLEKAKSTVGLRGYVKLNSIFDFNGLSDVDRFVPVEIPVGDVRNTQDRGFYMGARQSRLGFSSKVKAKTGYLNLYIEGDFAGGNTSQMYFRLRQAYAEYGYLTVGQTWTTFSNLEALPLTVDREGPNSSVAIRQGMIRYEKKVGDNQNVFAVAVESPTILFTDSVAIDQRQLAPDVVSRYKWTYADGHLQVSGLFRLLSYTNKNDNVSSEVGYGINLSGKQYLTDNEDNILYFQGIYGKGISRYVRGFRNYNFDAFFSPEGNIFIPQTAGGYFSLEHHWSKKLFSNITAGVTWLETANWQEDNAYQSSYYGSFNSYWFAFDRMQLGLGYIYGVRRNKDNERGYASRFQMYIRYDI
ncbi:DcaP family trimeric outer membrane transporter [Flammeovirga agarivorans]|uniref:SH3b domain-containing protein n=1 Tax=Flammeovirga agarivorans TaxID=2726742 RepID=A0A7X8SGK6_9BACT|nr:DcaP family trimeric outer membrane transporter [Flammeovirga agarivorans]NLR89804.1 hypothetical protein [Flammeovirga agarivorans]